MTERFQIRAMHPFRRLAVWEKAHELVLLLYPVIESRLRVRLPGVARQLERAIAAVPANLAEGAGHTSAAQFSRYIGIALASAREAEYHLLLARDLGALDSKQYAVFEARMGEIAAMLLGLQRRVGERSRLALKPPARARAVVRGEK